MGLISHSKTKSFVDYLRTREYTINYLLDGRPHSTDVAFLLSHPVTLGSILGISKIFSLDVAEIY